MSPVWPCLLNLICLIIYGVGVESQAGGEGVKVTTTEVTPTSIRLNIVCTGDDCEQTETSYIYGCIYHMDEEPKCEYGTGDVTFSNLKPVTQYTIIVNRRSGYSWKALETLYITTKESVLVAPEILKMPSMEDGTIIWEIFGNQENITGFELNIVAWRDYNPSFSLNVIEWFPPNVTQYKISLLPGTNYTFRIRGFTSVGGGDYKVITMETPKEVPTASPTVPTASPTVSTASSCGNCMVSATSIASQSSAGAGEEMDTAPISRSFLRQLLNQTITPVFQELSDMRAEIQRIGKMVESLEKGQMEIIADIKALVHGLHTHGARDNNPSVAIEDHVGGEV